MIDYECVAILRCLHLSILRECGNIIGFGTLPYNIVRSRTYICKISNLNIKSKIMKHFSSIAALLCGALLLASPVKSQEAYTILLSGASFAEPSNTWFEMGCRALGAKAINRAIGGESIANTANRMADGTLYTPEEFEQIDAFVIMQVHEKDVFYSDSLKENYTDYRLPFDNSDYAACYDYVIKRYITECYNLRFNPESRYYGSPYGKPAVIVLCTHWNDGRPLFNTTVRKLAEKWGLPVVEFDKLIGFSQNQKHPVTGGQPSRIFTADSQVVHGKTFGWHPQHGETSYIQQRMAAIFSATMRQILLPKEFITQQ